MLLTNKDRRLLLRPLGDAGWPLVTAVVGLRVVDALVPAATALTMAALVARLSRSADADVFRVALAPLVAFGAVIFAGHLIEAAWEPVRFAAKARIDGLRRARIAALASTSPTIGALEQPEVHELVRLAKADPDNWTERTPGDGALAQTMVLVGGIGVVASCAVLARYTWWPIPLLVAAAALARAISVRQALSFLRTWQSGISEGLKGDVWAELLNEPAEGKEVRIFGLADWAVERMHGHVLASFAPTWALGRRDLRRQWFAFGLIVPSLGLTYAFVTLSAVHGQTTIAVETAVFAASWSVVQGFFAVDARNQLGALPGLRAYQSLTRLLASNGADPMSTGRAPGSGPDSAGQPPLVRFEQVSFRYPGTEHTVLDSLDLEIHPGELLAIVGLNGAGKSTLIKLLSSLYEPSSGRITADGMDIARLGPAAWRRRISVVFQDFVRYQLPLGDNIALGQVSDAVDPARIEAMIEAAAHDAGMEALLARMPDGWSTPLARSRTGGVDLSGGQWQQVVLARALYSVRVGARLLVLDEPTAHLDVHTEFEVFARLAERRGESSVVLISHRLSTVRQADRIVVLDGGRITESGTHEELINLGGSYAEMFAIQAERFAAGSEDSIEEGELL